jgi:serine protease Do
MISRFNPMAVLARRTAAVALSMSMSMMGLALPVGAGLTLLTPTPSRAQQVTLPDFSELAERVGPSVVNIRTTERRGGGSGAEGNSEIDEQMREFFRRFGIPIPNVPNAPRGGGGGGGGSGGGGGANEEPVQRGVGSGFILSGDGFVMTNAHVVEGADEVIVTLTDKREFKAKIIGADQRTDVAVVKIDGSSLPAVKIGDVNRVKVGEWVMAIGSPFNLENTVTAGIVSAKQRDTGDLVPFIQTDVAINPGNSGGPLLNLRGEVIGINSQIYSRTGGFMGISFAIPIDEAVSVSEQLRANGRVIRGRIGVTIGPVTKDVAESIGLGKSIGAFVNSVETGGPAEKAGVEPGDIITKVDGKPVERSGDLPRIIGRTKPGTKSSLQVFRRGNYRDISVNVAEFEAEKPRRVAQGEPAPGPAGKNALGLAVSDVSEAQRRELKIKGGVQVDAVDGAAARAGIREGDVILSLDNTEITDPKQFGNLVNKLPKDKSVTALVRRGDWVSYVIIKPAR